MKHYNRILKLVIKALGNTITTNVDIDNYINNNPILKNKCNTTTSSDKTTRLTENKPYQIVNVDKSYENGSHWVALCYSSELKKNILYDSFGRPDIIGNGKYINTDSDPEQSMNETNCGARSVAFLLYFDKYGYEKAMEV